MRIQSKLIGSSIKMDSRKATALCHRSPACRSLLLIRVGSIFLIGIIIFLPVIAALRDVQVSVPPAVRRGDTATLHCYYDMDGESLYSVKWYKGRREFYRYTPKESPPMKIFPAQGVQVKRAASNESQLTLLGLSLSSSGKYSCEVSADAPSFHTMIVTGDLEVCEVPKHVPSIHGMRSRYRIGDIVRGNCTSHNSRPPANLTWYINEAQANPSYIRTHKPFRERKNEFETSLAGIHFVVGNHHFVNGKLKIRCTARIHDIYLQSTERSIDEDRPRVISAASSANSNGNVANGNAIPYDHFPPYAENELDRKDYMTHLQGDMASSGSTPTARPIISSTSLNSLDHFRQTAINQFRWAFGPLTVLLLPLAHPLLSSLLNRLSTSLRA